MRFLGLGVFGQTRFEDEKTGEKLPTLETKCRANEDENSGKKRETSGGKRAKKMVRKKTLKSDKKGIKKPADRTNQGPILGRITEQRDRAPKTTPGKPIRNIKEGSDKKKPSPNGVPRHGTWSSCYKGWIKVTTSDILRECALGAWAG